MKQDKSNMFDEIIAAAIKVAENYGVYITDDMAAERLTSAVDSHASNKRRQSDFFKSMMLEEERR